MEHQTHVEIQGARTVEAVDELCRLALAAARMGCRVRLLEVDAELRGLLLLAGVDAFLLDDEPKQGDLP